MTLQRRRTRPLFADFPLVALFRGFQKVTVDDLLTPLPEAIEELERRRRDPELQQRVKEYLGDDIPSYFQGQPILYLARHLASPNFETIRFSHLVDSYQYETVIGQDTKDLFVSHNYLKRSLCKLSIHTGMGKRGKTFEERYENLTIVDFNAWNGKPFSKMQTLWGQSLVEFHQELCAEYLMPTVRIVDDSDWIDRNNRGDVLAHYKRFLALFVVNGILSEDYMTSDKEECKFVRDILRPAFNHVERVLGVRPLISHLTPTAVETPKFWMSYPLQVGMAVKKKLAEHRPS